MTDPADSANEKRQPGQYEKGPKVWIIYRLKK